MDKMNTNEIDQLNRDLFELRTTAHRIHKKLRENEGLRKSVTDWNLRLVNCFDEQDRNEADTRVDQYVDEQFVETWGMIEEENHKLSYGEMMGAYLGGIWNAMDGQDYESLVHAYTGETLVEARRKHTEISPEFVAAILMAAIDNVTIEHVRDVDANYWNRVAENMGPDWAQALYHTAVYMTRVA